MDLSTARGAREDAPSVIRVTAICACIVAAAALAACTEAPRHAAIPAGSTVLALGDSLTYGTGARQGAYPDRLAEVTGWTLVNGGVPGNTAAQGCERLPALIDEHRPALVLVLLGGNDFLRRRPESEVTAALEACVTAARAGQAAVVLMPVPRPGIGRLSNAPLYQEAAKRLGVPLADAGLAALLGDASKRADPIHLNGDGYRELAETLAGELRRLGFLGR
jgi:acyl-CoA hydrolase